MTIFKDFAVGNRSSPKPEIESMRKIVVTEDGSTHVVKIPDENISRNRICLPYDQSLEYGLEVELQYTGIHNANQQNSVAHIGLEIITKLRNEDISKHSDYERLNRNFYAYGALTTDLDITPSELENSGISVVSPQGTAQDIPLSRPWHWGLVAFAAKRQGNFYAPDEVFTTGAWNCPIWCNERGTTEILLNDNKIFQILVV